MQMQAKMQIMEVWDQIGLSVRPQPQRTNGGLERAARKGLIGISAPSIRCPGGQTRTTVFSFTSYKAQVGNI